MKNIAIDIETAPLPNVMSLINKHYPFDPEKVKYGNAKKPELRKEIREAAEVSHAFKIKEGAQLDPLLSYVCAIGILEEGEKPIMKTCIDHKLEPKVLTWLSVEIQTRWTGPLVRWVGWNIHDFDLPYLFKRYWLTGTTTPSGLRRGRYWDQHWVDLMKEWCFYGWQQYSKLEDVAELLGVCDLQRPNDVEAKDFWKVLREDEEKAKSYLSADLSETLAIAEAIL